MTASEPEANTFTIPRRFRGPVDSGNGGYTCGTVAGFLPGDTEVTLRAPPPLERQLRVERLDGTVTIFDGQTLVAEGRRVVWDVQVPAPPTLAEARDASARYAGLTRHAFPECFVCGTDRPDGLAVFAGPVEGRDLVASPWVPDPSLPNTGGVLPAPMVWAALDCPGAWAEERHLESEPVVLGRMAARVLQPVSIGTSYVAVGWPIGREGRKLHSGTALFSAEGILQGYASQTWIVLTR